MIEFSPWTSLMFLLIFFGAYIIPTAYILLSIIFLSLNYHKKNKKLFWMTVVPGIIFIPALIWVINNFGSVPFNIPATLFCIIYFIFLLFQWMIFCCSNKMKLLKNIQYLFLGISTTLLISGSLFTKAIFFQYLVIFLLLSIILLIPLFIFIKYKK